MASRGGTSVTEPVGTGRAHRAGGGGIGPAVVMAAGLGWVGGTYSWPGPSWLAQLLITAMHLLPVALVLLAVRLIVSGYRPQVGRVLLTVLACCVKVVTVVAWILVHPHGPGPHGLIDWVPIGLCNAGGGLWLLAMIRGRAAYGSDSAGRSDSAGSTTVARP